MKLETETATKVCGEAVFCCFAADSGTSECKVKRSMTTMVQNYSKCFV